jgi:hypothetical protein
MNPIDVPPSITRHGPGWGAGVDFSTLRQEGLRHVQALAGGIWTDYNLHDPGVTMLEALCFALTELAYRADAEVADHLCGPDGTINFDRQGLFEPEHVLPSRAITAADLRAWLLDKVSGLADVTVSPRPTGLLQLRLRLDPELPEDAVQDVKLAVRRAYCGQRGLGEDLDDRVVPVAKWPCSLDADIEISGSCEPVSVLAEVYHVCARFITDAAALRSADEMLLHGASPEQVFTGPSTRGRVQRRAADEAELAERLPVSALAEAVRGIDGVRGLIHFALKLETEGKPREVSAGSVPWRKKTRMLVLDVPGSGAKPGGVRLMRRGSRVEVDEGELARAFADLSAAARRRSQKRVEALMTAALPRGRPLPRLRHASVQQHFPAAYGLGLHGLPANADVSQRTRIRQLSTYLALFDQVMANGQAQIENIRELLSPAAAEGPSYWWHMIDDDCVPGIESLYLRDPDKIREQAFEAFDNAAARRHRALDLLLALYGQTYAQNTMRQFLGYLDTRTLEKMLLRNKAAFLREAALGGGNRTAGFDYMQPSPGTSGVQRLVSLLLGFESVPGSSLCAAWRGRGGTANESALLVTPRLDSLHADNAMPLALPVREGNAAPVQPSFRAPKLEQTILWAGVDRQRWRWRPGEAGRSGELLLGPDENKQWWVMGEASGLAEASVLADRLRRWLLGLNHASEGLHVVEHVLLRPRFKGRGHQDFGVGADFHRLRVTVVFPSWTVRTKEPAFRNFAVESVKMTMPAHVAAKCLWLEFAEMEDFEADLQNWQAELQRHAQDSKAETAQSLDAASGKLVKRLLQHGVR